MSVTVVGSVALDTVETAFGRNKEGLGGSATYFAFAAAQFSRCHLVGVVGEDFSDKHMALLESSNIDLEGLERVPGKTFRWSGRYHADINERDTLDTQLNVFALFHPKVPQAARDAEYLFLGNIQPALQLEVLEQVPHRFVGMDTMNLWIDTARDELDEVIGKVDALIVNDGEARMLTGQSNVVKAARALRNMGPDIVVIKKGEHGCLLFQGPDKLFAIPALPLESIVDPTGAGDAFAGGFMGYIAAQGRHDFDVLPAAVAYGSVAATFACEAFGPERLATLDSAGLAERYADFKRLTAF